MELLVVERVRTNSAFLIGEEFTEYGPSWTNLDDLSAFILSRQVNGRTAATVMREEGNEIVIDFYNKVGIVTSQLSICYNEGDHDKIISELSGFCQPAKIFLRKT